MLRPCQMPGSYADVNPQSGLEMGASELCGGAYAVTVLVRKYRFRGCQTTVSDHRSAQVGLSIAFPGRFAGPRHRYIRMSGIRVSPPAWQTRSGHQSVEE